MKKMKKLSLFLFLTTILITACSEQKEEEVIPQFLDVQLSVNPEQGNINQPITFTAKVMYGEKAVTDPDDIKFEIWRANNENHEEIPVEHAGDGVYELEKRFTEEGTYYIYAHVTAESMHSMPKKEFVIGQPSEPETDVGSSGMNKDELHKDKGDQP